MTDTLRVVFVCSGNICRSPLAEHLAKQLFAARDIPAVVISAGTLGLQGRPAAANSIAAAAEIGIDLQGHRSQGVSPALLDMADHIVVMTPRHESTLVDQNPNWREKIVHIWTFCDENLDGIPDPVGGDMDAFRQMRDRLRQAVATWIDQLPS